MLRMLESTSTPAPKKRMLMKSTFGDYRKKMADELQHIDASLLQISSSCEFYSFSFISIKHLREIPTRSLNTGWV